MKFLVMTPGVFDKGGIARYGRFQIQALREAFGEEAVEVFSLLGRQDDDLETPFRVNWTGALPLTFGSRALFSWESARAVRRSRPDVMLTQLIHLGPLAWALARSTGARLVQNIYGSEVWSPISWLRRKALRRTDLVLSDCHNSADRALDLGLVRTRPTVVWDCVDIESFNPAPAKPGVLLRYGLRDTGRFRVLFLGRLVAAARYKGSERLIRLAATLPATEFEVVFAGKGDDVDHLRSLAQEAGVAEHVQFTGAIHEDDLPDVYRSAGAFYLVSEAGTRKGEGIPLAPMEAMACGVPVLVGNQDASNVAVKAVVDSVSTAQASFMSC